MTVLADYTFIESGPKTIGDSLNPFTKDFNTGGRLGGNMAFLVLMVSGLVLGKVRDGAMVKINGKNVGTIYAASNSDWRTLDD